jgi:hypothetical protein
MLRKVSSAMATNNAFAIISLFRYLDPAENIPVLLVFLGSTNA